MYAGVMQFTIQPGQIDNAIKAWNEEMVPPFTKLPGWKGAYMLTDQATGRVISIGLYETREYAVGAADVGLIAESFAKLRPYLSDEPVRSMFEVTGHFPG
ncbi:MAG: hypothetical protein ABFD54_09130 [Armatimonadota bacterium]|nr:hypothetical protein [bacterium]